MTHKNCNRLAIVCAAVAVLVLVAGGDYKLFQQQTEIQRLQQMLVAASAGYAPLVAEWSPVVPQVNCYFADSSKDDGGGGTLLKRSNGIFYILTNAHLVLNDDNALARHCDVIFPDAASTTYTVTRAQITTNPNGSDAALLQLPQDSYLTALVSTDGRKICTAAPNLGDATIDLGYPGIGSSNGITVSQGIVAGDEGDYFVNTALTDDGSSGGAAIDVKDDCYFGIPSFVTGDDTASLGRTLKWGAMFTNDPLKLSEARL